MPLARTALKSWTKHKFSCGNRPRISLRFLQCWMPQFNEFSGVCWWDKFEKNHLNVWFMLPSWWLHWKVILLKQKKQSTWFLSHWSVSGQVGPKVEGKEWFLGRWWSLVGEEGAGWYLSVQDSLGWCNSFWFASLQCDLCEKVVL